MANLIKFDEFDGPRNHNALCIACEEMLTDALDEILSAADQAWFDRHISTCADCSQTLADAQRGAAWLSMLKSPRPEPSASLMERILAQTSGAQTSGLPSGEATVSIGQPAAVLTPAALPTPVAARSNLLAFRPRLPQIPVWSKIMFEPRMAMTAAMAFFSIALTLNLAGVRLDHLNASTLKPTNLKRTYYEANADAGRYLDNLRVVRVMESRVDDLRDNNIDSSPQKQPESQQK